MGAEFLLVRAVVQRASQASVKVSGATVGSRRRRVRMGDPDENHQAGTWQAADLARKIFYLRILRDEKSCADTGAPLLVISQFTLYGDTRKGRRPTWQAAAPGPVAEPLVTAFADALTELGATVQTGVFGADMQVMLVNDGPVTLILDAEPPRGAGG
jgi:D-tyrosyl-tRNA(Tyr) deacylase